MRRFIDRLHAREPLIAVEMRPPRADLDQFATMDAWLTMNRTVDRLLRRDTLLFFTDNAVGTAEEENLQHLMTNLDPEVDRARVCPFLTLKHTLEHCLWYAARAVAEGHNALAVLGGDRTVGPPRCVPHAQLLRVRLRGRHRDDLALGGWANPYRDPLEQARFLSAPDAAADFFLTQIVSHHEMEPVARFREACELRGLRIPGVFGVFYYRSANRRTFGRLAPFIRVPEAGLVREFDGEGLHPDEVCARTIRALRAIGIRHVYVSNLPLERAAERLDRIRELVEG